MEVTAKNKMRFTRFTLIQRIFHLFLMLSFFIQAATGLSRMYMETKWGMNLGALFGGYETARSVHIFVGIVMLMGFLVHVFYLVIKIDWKNFSLSLFGPDSLLPRVADIKQFFQHIAWFFGKKKPPPFDRWGYWEKFDYWAVFWGMTIIGFTGLVIAYPLYSTKFMPGWGLNIAFWIHRIEAILAMAHIFIIHFFIGHLRCHNFPMDRSMFEGSTPLSSVEDEKPAWINRIRALGRYDQMLVDEQSIAVRILYYLFGYAAISFGIFLLIGSFLNYSGVTW